MDTKVVASCAVCGEVQTVASKVQIRLCVNRPDATFCVMDCPQCGAELAKTVGQTIASMLINCGATATTWVYAAEADETHTGLPINYDDILDFHLNLSDEVIYAELGG